MAKITETRHRSPDEAKLPQALALDRLEAPGVGQQHADRPGGLRLDRLGRIGGVELGKAPHGCDLDRLGRIAGEYRLAGEYDGLLLQHLFNNYQIKLYCGGLPTGLLGISSTSSIYCKRAWPPIRPGRSILAPAGICPATTKSETL